MKRALFLITLVTVTTAAFAGLQFRVAAQATTPLESLPQGEEWSEAFSPTSETLTGWHWELIFGHFGLGMHYGMRFYETELLESPYLVDWKGDFFLSYHIMGAGSVIDPFLELGWGNAGTATASYDDRHEYPDWEDELHGGTATALAHYTYVGAGLALDLNGLLLGVRVLHVPSELVSPTPDPDVALYRMSPFELGIFGGIALGGHDRKSYRKHHWHDWGW